MLVCNQCDKNETEVKIFKKRMICKKCSDKIWRENNKEKESLKVKRWRENNKEKALERQKEWYIRNKEQMNEKSKEWYDSNKDKVLEKQKEWYENNKEYKLEKTRKYQEENREYYKEKNNEWYYENREEVLERQKEYNKENREKTNKRQSERVKNDKIFKIKRILSSSIKKSLNSNGYSKNSRTSKILGCSFEEFKIYLESKFESWMNWDNQGLYNGELNYGWDIDHIIPSSSAKTEEEVIKLNHYSNLQPLCGYTNRHIKRDTI